MKKRTFGKIRNAQKILKELEKLKQEVAEFSDLKEEIASLEEILDLSKDDKRIEKEIVENLQEIEKKVRKFEFNILFSGEYDERNAILSIHSGTGGADAQDWAEMLLRMYLRFCRKKKLESKNNFRDARRASGNKKRHIGNYREIRLRTSQDGSWHSSPGATFAFQCQ